MSEELLGTTKVTRHNQITLPKKVRDELDIKQGNMVGFVKDKETGEVIIRSAKLVYKK